MAPEVTARAAVSTEVIAQAHIVSAPLLGYNLASEDGGWMRVDDLLVVWRREDRNPPQLVSVDATGTYVAHVDTEHEQDTGLRVYLRYLDGQRPHRRLRPLAELPGWVRDLAATWTPPPSVVTLTYRGEATG